jgi:hypothetical protein
MSSKSSMLLKVLLNRFHPGGAPPYLKFLPQEASKEVTSDTIQSQDLSPYMSWPTDVIVRTHYSWLEPIMKKLPHAVQGPVLAAMPESHAAGLSRLLNVTVPTVDLSPKFKTFLLKQVYNEWNPHEILPIAYMPASNLMPLLDLSKTELVTIIDLLAMHDLADALRHIVDKKNLRNIYLCLTQKEQQFLRICLHKREKLTAPKLEIEKWDGKKETLENILHKRGMLRLGKAICGQSRQFLWHLTHILDTGRGTVISQYYQDTAIPNTTAVLALQVISTINFLKGKSEA